MTAGSEGRIRTLPGIQHPGTDAYAKRTHRRRKREKAARKARRKGRR